MDWSNFYVIAVEWGIQPSEFWRMSPQEWWALYEHKRPRDKTLDYAGSLNDADCAELYEMLT